MSYLKVRLIIQHSLLKWFKIKQTFASTVAIEFPISIRQDTSTRLVPTGFSFTCPGWQTENGVEKAPLAARLKRIHPLD